MEAAADIIQTPTADDCLVRPYGSSRVEILPSSTLRDVNRDVVFGEHDFAEGKIAWIPVFCASCHRRGPRTPLDAVLSGGFVCWLCRDCGEKMPHMIGVCKIPDEVFNLMMHEAMIEKYGRRLDNREIEDQLHDPNSLMSKLARSRDAYRRMR